MKVFNEVIKFVKKNKYIILSGISCGGVVATAICSAKATEKLLTDEETTAAVYIPTGIIAAGTIASIILTSKHAKRDIKNMTVAYGYLSTIYHDYRKEIKDRYGEEVDKEISDKVIEETPPDDLYPREYDDEDQLFYDSYTGEFFEAPFDWVVDQIFTKTKIDGDLSCWMINQEMLGTDYPYNN